MSFFAEASTSSVRFCLLEALVDSCRILMSTMRRKFAFIKALENNDIVHAIQEFRAEME